MISISISRSLTGNDDGGDYHGEYDVANVRRQKHRSNTIWEFRELMF